MSGGSGTAAEPGQPVSGGSATAGGRYGAFRDRYGPWAVVVGGSEGVGAAFAAELAARGLDLVLVARRPQPLAATAGALRAAYRIDVRTLAVHAGRPDAPAIILDEVAALDVGLLVCSAALSPVGSWMERTPAEIDAMLDLNCRVPAQLSRAMAARLRERDPARGGIVLISSMAGLQGSARIAGYAATKAYLRVLAEGLWSELRPAGIDVLACCPGMVDTPTLRASAPRPAPWYSPPVMPAGRVARESLAALGHRAVVIPGRWNRVAAFASTRLLPRSAAVAFGSAATRAMYPDGPRAPRRWARPGGPSG